VSTLFIVDELALTLHHSAQAYGNEAEVGDGIQDAGVPRESFFLTTKIDNMNHKHVAQTMDESLKRLKTDYVDLVLMHWPVSIGMSRFPFFSSCNFD
jgi:glycerol 2-dehydrogenase (NADP+)